MSLSRRRFLQKDSSDKPDPRSKRLRHVCSAALRLGIYLLASLVTACLFTLAYPNYSYAWLMWVALAPFTLALISVRRFWTSFWYSWFTGLCVYAGIYYWIFITCYQGGGLSPQLSTAAWLGLSALLSLQFS